MARTLLRPCAVRGSCEVRRLMASPYEPCGAACVSERPILDTANGREHDDCPERCTRCGGLGEVAVASHDLGGVCYNDDFGTCPQCHGSGKA
jgi:hypothetical protein